MMINLDNKMPSRWEIAEAKGVSEEDFVRSYRRYLELCAEGNLKAFTDEEWGWYVDEASERIALPEIPPVYKGPFDLGQGMEISASNREKVKAFVDSIGNPALERPSLYIFGGPGTGKTRLTHIIRRYLPVERLRLMREGQRIRSYPVPLFHTVGRMLHSEQQDFDAAPEDKKGLIDTLMDFKRLVILDDLGAENITGWSRGRLLDLINHRYEWKLPTIYTTNLNPDELSKAMGDRMASRVVGSCALIDLGTRDRRMEGIKSNELPT